MNDAPLFQNMDEQESVYAPQPGSDTDDQVSPEADGVPAGLAGATMLPGGGAGGVASTSGMLPANALSEIADDPHEDPTVKGN